MANLKFIQNTDAIINSTPVLQGQLLYTTDTKKTYYDSINGNRIVLTNVNYVVNYSDLEALSPTRPRNNLYVVTSTKLIYVYDHNNQWKNVIDSYEIPSYLLPTESLLPVTLEKNGISYAPRTMISCVYNNNGEPLSDLVNFKDASTTERGVVLLYDNYDTTDTNVAPTVNALNKLYQYIKGNSYKAADSDKLDGLDSTRFLQYGDTNNKDGYFDKSTTTPTGTSRINYSGYLYATRVYNAVYNDYAEYFERDKDIEFEVGDVISKDPETDFYIRSNSEYDKNVVGVFSGEYAHCIGGKGDGNDDEDYIPVGLAGRLHVKVKGKVKIGDLLVSSDIPGVAMKSDIYMPGTVIGKVLENKSTEDIGMIKMLIMNI